MRIRIFAAEAAATRAAGLALLLAWVSGAAAARADAPDDALESQWSFTLLGQYTQIPSPEDDDHVGGWFDQYEFTPNKSSDFPFQLGVRDAAVDLFRDESAIFQARFRSPTSNLGVSGSQADDPFFDQRLDALTRLDGLDVDLSYRRMRTEQLRIFPNTEGPGLVFEDRSRAKDRFQHDRTGFAAEARLRPDEAFDWRDAAEGQGTSRSWLRPELSLRGGYEKRDGHEQLRIHRTPSNQWLGLTRDRERSVGDVGGSVLVAPDGRFTLSIDFDHEQFRSQQPILTEGDIGFAPPASDRTLAFIPETDRNTGTVRFNSQLWDRLVVEGGFQFSELEQVSERTPRQLAAGLDDNKIRTYGANAAFDLALLPDVSLNGFFKFDRRDHDIDRDTPLFNPTNQVDPFVDHWQRVGLGSEVEVLLAGLGRAALGLRYEDVERDRDFAVFGGRRILKPDTHLGGNTRIVTLYGRTAARPWRRLRVDAELGYRWAPDTGYAMDLDQNLYGELRASYTFDLPRPIVVSGYARGGTGENDDFHLVAGQGPVPNGAVLPRNYEQSNFVVGATASGSPVDRLSLSASIFYGRADQDATLDLSTLQRYVQDIAPLQYTNEGKSRFENQQLSLVTGLHYQLDDRTDAGVSYTFTRVEADYSGSDFGPNLNLIDASHRIDSDVHVLDLEAGRWVAEGLRVIVGYRYQRYHDDVGQPQSVASVVTPFDPSTHQHTVSLGVTLTSAFFAR